MWQSSGNKALKQIAAGISLLTACNVYAQSETADSLKLSKELEEIVITAPESIVTGEKTIYIPEKRLIDAMNSTIQLLAGLQLPELTVNPATGSINILGGGKLSIRINGRPVSEREVALVSPKQITKIEYINNPGAMYDNADGVINITVMPPRTSGYSIYTNLLQSPNKGWGDYTAAVKYNVGKSEWSIDYHSNPMWDMDCYRDNNEKIILPDGTHIRREEAGIKTPNRMVTHRGAVQYSYAESNQLLCNVQARVLHTNDYYHTRGIITTSVNGKTLSTTEEETNPIKSWQGDIDIYLYKQLNRHQNIYFNIVPTIIQSLSGHSYATSDIEIINSSRQNGYRLSIEGVWEYRLNNGSLSAGIRSNSRWDSLRYFPDNSISHEDLSQNSIFAEWRHSAAQWQYGIGATLSYCAGSSTIGEKPAVNPKAYLLYRVRDWGNAGIYLESHSVAPGVNETNPTLQRVDQFQWSIGNDRLKSYRDYKIKGDFSVRAGALTARVIIENRYACNPIMPAKTYIGGMIVQSPRNAGHNNHLDVHGMVRVPLFSNRVMLTAEGGWHRFDSKGFNYTHTYSQPYINLQMMLLIKNWWIMAKYNSSYNRLWGEMISSANQNLTNLGIGYTYKSMTLMAGIVNPFGNVALKSRDLSAIAGYDRIYQATGSNSLIWAGVTINLRKGKSRAASQKKLENENIYESITNAKK